MIVYFVETEQEERAYFAGELAGDEVHFVEKGDEVGGEAEVVSIFIGTHVDHAFLERLPQLRMLSTRSRALDHIDLEACRTRGVIVCHVPQYGETTVAEHTFALILALSRRLREMMVFARQPDVFSYEGARAFDLKGKTLGLVGMGRIGQRVCELAHAFQMEVAAFDPVAMLPERAESGGFTWMELEPLLGASHIVSLHVNLSPWTHHMINRERLALCRRGALLINTARGRLVDTEALREAMESGQIGGAGLDVLEEESVLRQPASTVISAQILEHLRADTDPVEVRHRGRLKNLQSIMSSQKLLERSNVVFTPHVAFNSIETVEQIAQETVRTIRAFGAGQLVNAV